MKNDGGVRGLLATALLSGAAVHLARQQWPVYEMPLNRFGYDAMVVCFVASQLLRNLPNAEEVVHGFTRDDPVGVGGVVFQTCRDAIS